MGEDRGGRLDREVMELLNELRVMLPGVQILFAFLLAAPFNQRFTQLSLTERGAYFIALLAATAASAFLIAPSTYARLRWRQRDKERMLRTSNRLTITGTVFLAMAILSSLYLVTELLFDGPVTIAVPAVAALVFAVLWYALPLSRVQAPEQAEENR